jgi:hypothetical protein
MVDLSMAMLNNQMVNLNANFFLNTRVSISGVQKNPTQDDASKSWQASSGGGV